MSDDAGLHNETLDRALQAIDERTYWSAYPEHPKAYGEVAPSEGEAAFNALIGTEFATGQSSDGFATVEETSPYGISLGVSYPRTSVDTVIHDATAAMAVWSKTSPEERAEVCLEILDRLATSSFEMAHAVMHTTGQSFLMAFQAGGPHALDRALEAVAYTYREQKRIPGPVTWEKPQGSRPPLVIEKNWVIKPRGIAVTIGVSTFPTWNGYPGVFASLAAGNPVIVKPHQATVLPFALLVRTARDVLSDMGHDPNVIQMIVDTPGELVAKDLVMRPEVGIVDYTGGSAFGDWLEENVTHAEVYTEKAGVNSVIIDSLADAKGAFRNLSVSMTMYSGQMCTTPQNLFVPADGVPTSDGHISYDDIVSGFVGAIDGLLGDDARAGSILGAIKGTDALDRIDVAQASGTVLLTSRAVPSDEFPGAIMRTPAIVEVDGANKDVYMTEMFGPVIFVVKTASRADSVELAREAALRSGAITWLAYAMEDAAVDAIVGAAVDGGVSVAFNLTGGLFVNQSAAFSDFHVTGANSAGNSSLSDPAFVVRRFRVIGIRTEAAPAV
ncbi:MAG: phenylacetic acid degradation protein PaaN [Actinomycetota bacterium]|nr:phenylacetic acid degradation protein PaaN [Actinomycetota bacterium]